MKVKIGLKVTVLEISGTSKLRLKSHHYSHNYAIGSMNENLAPT